jgi:hypothetical protein
MGKMKNRFKILQLCFLAALLCIAPISANANNGMSGIGIIIGNPTGISLKFPNDKETHFNAVISWALKNDPDIYLHVDYIFKTFAPIAFTQQFSMTPIIGVGGRLESTHGNSGIRLPFGLTHKLQKNPIEFLIEIIPALDIFPATDFNVGVAFAVRYLF